MESQKKQGTTVIMELLLQIRMKKFYPKKMKMRPKQSKRKVITKTQIIQIRKKKLHPKLKKNRPKKEAKKGWTLRE